MFRSISRIQFHRSMNFNWILADTLIIISNPTTMSFQKASLTPQTPMETEKEEEKPALQEQYCPDPDQTSEASFDQGATDSDSICDSSSDSEGQQCDERASLIQTSVMGLIAFMKRAPNYTIRLYDAAKKLRMRMSTLKDIILILLGTGDVRRVGKEKYQYLGKETGETGEEEIQELQEVSEELETLQLLEKIIDENLSILSQKMRESGIMKEKADEMYFESLKQDLKRKYNVSKYSARTKEWIQTPRPDQPRGFIEQNRLDCEEARQQNGRIRLKVEEMVEENQ